MKRIAIYARVSTTDQICENQLQDLRQYCSARGFENVTEFVDHGISGSKEKRPALDKLMVEVKARRVDVVIVAAFDRFGRSVRHKVGLKSSTTAHGMFRVGGYTEPVIHECLVKQDGLASASDL